MNCPSCNKSIFLEPIYKDHLCKNKDCSLYLKGDVFNLFKNNNKSCNYQEKINTILDNFDFIKVHQVMVALNWCWGSNSNPPTINEIKTTVNSNFLQVIEKASKSPNDYCMKTGGFSYLFSPSTGFLELTFELESFYS